jgi:hypothetical protein
MIDTRSAALALCAAGILALAGCQENHSFEQTLRIRDAADARPVGQAWIVRALHESHEQTVGRGQTRVKRWTARVEILPAGNGVEYAHPADAPPFTTDAFTRQKRGDRYYEMFLFADGYCPMHITANELHNGQFQLRRMEDAASGRSTLRAAEFVEQVVLPNTTDQTPGRDEVLRLVLAQLQALQRRGLANLGLAGRIERLQAALSPAPTARAQ